MPAVKRQNSSVMKLRRSGATITSVSYTHLIRLSRGKSARYDKSAQVISWESAAESIGELLDSGQFTTNVELTEAAGYELSLIHI